MFVVCRIIIHDSESTNLSCFGCRFLVDETNISWLFYIHDVYILLAKKRLTNEEHIYTYVNVY